MARRVELTVDEIIAVLTRSSIPTILVEGPDDVLVYRWLKQFINPMTLQPQQCFGRNNLLKIYERKDEFSNIKTVFLADKDMYLFMGIPEEYSDIVWTTGYSIENDIYAGTTIFDDLMEEDELEKFNEIMNDIIKWFAYEVQQFLSNNSYKIDIKMLYNQTPNNDETYIDVKYKNDRSSFDGNLIPHNNYSPPPSSILALIQQDYKLKVRGKIIFDLLNLFFSAPKRQAKYRPEALFEMGVKPADRHPYIKKIINKINDKLGN